MPGVQLCAVQLLVQTHVGASVMAWAQVVTLSLQGTSLGLGIDSADARYQLLGLSPAVGE
jgi:hypothetical protein